MFGIQNGNDRVLTAQVESEAKDFQSIAVRIGDTKSRDLRTTDDYIAAYNEIDPLLSDFDAKLQSFNAVINEVQQREKTRGPLNIQRLYGRKSYQWLQWDVGTFDLLRQDSELTRKQIGVIRQMAELPKEDQVAFCRTNFEPLQKGEGVIRQKLSLARQNMPSAAK